MILSVQILVRLVCCLGAPALLWSATLAVGPGKNFPTPCAAATAAKPGDIVEIDAAGRYLGDVCVIKVDRLTLRGVNGRPIISADGKAAQEKAIWVIQGNGVLLENLELVGAMVPDHNGAGIRHEGGDLTIRDCFFHHNENGILTASNKNAHVIIEYCEFAWNGYGDGLSHNMYIGHVGRFTLRYTYSHDAKQGHLVKSRAAENHILYNRLSTETSNASMELDIPNGGTTYVIGNLIYQGPNSANANFFTYQLEGSHPDNPGTALYVVHNTFINERYPMNLFIAANPSLPTPPVILNNIFDGAGRITNHTYPQTEGNVRLPSLRYVDSERFDYRLAAGSPGIDGAVPVPENLRPVYQYVHPACAAARHAVGCDDAGAFESGAAPGSPPPNAPGRCRATAH